MLKYKKYLAVIIRYTGIMNIYSASNNFLCFLKSFEKSCRLIDFINFVVIF